MVLHPGEIDVSIESTLSIETARELVRICRAAYATGDPVAGLPVADGARETPQDVLRDLAGGQQLFIARVNGAICGSVRAVVDRRSEWQVRRLCSDPTVRRGGVARSLMAALESAAATAGASSVCLEAVVERGNPPIYQRLGYHVVEHFPADDKPLSEVKMGKPLVGTVSPSAFLAPTGVVISWLAGPSGVRGVLSDRLSEPGPDETLVAIDCAPTGGGEVVDSVRRALGPDLLTPAAGSTSRRPPVMPRLIDTRLLAWFRSSARPT